MQSFHNLIPQALFLNANTKVPNVYTFTRTLYMPAILNNTILRYVAKLNLFIFLIDGEKYDYLNII